MGDRTPSYRTWTTWTLVSLSLLIISSEAVDIYHNQFAVHIPAGAHVAESIARKHGFVNLGQIGSLENYYLFETHRLSKRSVGPCDEHRDLLEREPDVLWHEQQRELKRTKRDGRQNAIGDFEPKNRITRRSAQSVNPSDPLFSEQWFLNNGARDGSDINVKSAWSRGVTGKGVVVTILDDGIQYNHPDLSPNYDPLASKDINDNDDDPMPQDNGDNKHGTRCAGEVAAVAFNGYCGVGVAFNASIGGVRMLDGVVNDAVEAKSLSLNPSHIHIYSASWGPEDDGKTVDGPGPLAKQAFIDGINKGRDGKGSIFVWASGNGGHHTDNCNCDGYTNSIFTLSISSATQGGLKPWYLEECSSTLATTYSSGTPGQDASITTVDQDARLRNDKICTSAHSGTSASAPLAAGVCALALEANMNLTWRDMQHIVVYTSNPKPLQQERGWDLNAVGRSFSHKFGYGLLDAGQLVELASLWASVPSQHICETRVESPQLVLPRAVGMKTNVSMITDGCDNMLSKVRYLEHVQCRVSLKYYPRGQLKISLRSPRGTRSYLLLPRPKDRMGSGFEDWPFLSVHFWGEDPTGEWTLEISNAGPGEASSEGILKHWQLVLYGTENSPFRGLSPEVVKTFGLHGDSQSAIAQEDEESMDSASSFSPASNRTESADGIASKTSQSSEQETELTMKSCHTECVKGCYGIGPDKCHDCRHYVLVNEVNGGRGEVRTCSEQCSSGHYVTVSHTSSGRRIGDSSASPWGKFPATGELGECRICHHTCQECFGPDSNSCSTCQTGLFYLDGRSSCVKTCPEGTYFNPRSSTCERCPASCRTCGLEHLNVNVRGQMEATGLQEAEVHLVCNSCKPELMLTNRQCQPRCPPGHYVASNVTQDWGACQPCHPSCESCTGPLDTQCGKCGKGTYYFERRCVPYCPPGYFSEERLRECVSCTHGCDSCPKSEGICEQCKQGWFLFEGDCLPPDSKKCQPGMYFSGGTCLACHNSCKTCNGPKDTACSSCYPDHRLHITTCVEVCPERTRPARHGLNSCLSCPHACMSCEASESNSSVEQQGHRCTGCIPGYFLDVDSGECVTSCPLGFFGDQDLICRPCHPSCSECFERGSNQCLACNQSHGTPWLANGSCYSACPDGTFSPGPGRPDNMPSIEDDISSRQSSTRHCESCHPACSTCSGSGPYNCTSCRLGLAPVLPPRAEGAGVRSSHISAAGGENIRACVPCGAGFYLNNDGRIANSSGSKSKFVKCSACHETCGTCSGSESNQCTSCLPHLHFDSWTGSCVPCCGEGGSEDPCCVCDREGSGVCTAPSRGTRSLGGSGSITFLSIGFLGAVGLGCSSFYILCRAVHMVNFKRRFMPKFRKADLGKRAFRSRTRESEYSQVPVGSPGDTSPFLQRSEIYSSQSELSMGESDSDNEETRFQMINS